MKRIYEHNDIQPILERLLQDKESSEIEFKSAAGGFTKSFWETYTSFVNTNGRANIFGVKEKAGEFCLDRCQSSNTLTSVKVSDSTKQMRKIGKQIGHSSALIVDKQEADFVGAEIDR